MIIGNEASAHVEKRENAYADAKTNVPRRIESRISLLTTRRQRATSRSRSVFFVSLSGQKKYTNVPGRKYVGGDARVGRRLAVSVNFGRIHEGYAVGCVSSRVRGC